MFVISAGFTRTPHKTSQNTSSIPTPPTAPIASPLHIPRTPLSRTPVANRFLYNPPSPTVIPPGTPPPTPSSQTKQKLLSSWLKSTPSKENIQSNSQQAMVKNDSSAQVSSSKDEEKHLGNDNRNNKVNMNYGNRAKKIIISKNKKSLFKDRTSHSDKKTISNKTVSSTKTISSSLSAKRNSDELQHDLCVDISSPARKRQCIDSVDSKDNASQQKQYNVGKSEDVLSDEKENIGPCNSCVKTEEQSTDNKNINWFINWKIYIKQNKGDSKRHKSPTIEQLGENENEQLKEKYEVGLS